MAKFNRHSNFGKVFAFTHSNEKLKENLSKNLCLRILSHNLCCSVHTKDDKSAKITRVKHICSCKLACVMPMLLDLILVKHFRMRRDRKRHSAAALVMYMVMYKVYRRRLCWTRLWLMNRDLELTRTLVQEMQTGDKETVCFAGLAKG